jgi:hypothetical protein
MQKFCTNPITVERFYDLLLRLCLRGKSLKYSPWSTALSNGQTRPMF